jgi:protein O-GlcNAc transferase
MSGPPAEWKEAVLHYQAGRLVEAEKACRRLLERLPNQPDTLGLLAAAVQQQGRLADAETLFARVTVLQPTQARAWNNLANNQAEQSKREAAVESYRRALALQPDYPVALKNLGQTLRELERATEALDCYRRAVALQPNYAEAYLGLGLTLGALGQSENAIAAIRQAITIKPDYAEAYNNLGNLLRAEALDEAIEAYERAILLRADFAEAHSNLGFALRDKGRLEPALASCRRALELDPAYVGAHTNLALVLLDQGRSAEAMQHLRTALDLMPSNPEANDMFAGLLKDQGRLDEAVATYQKVLRTKPNFAIAHSNLIFALDLLPGAGFAEQQAERKRWWKQHAERLAPAAVQHTNAPDPDRRLRIGYVSADFKQHSAAFCFGAVLRRHDRAGFEVVCYSGVPVEDRMTREFRELADAWRPTTGTGEGALAEQVRVDGIDILVDLSGHSAGNRLLAFARKPAPVQVSAWGHANGTGLGTMDYLFSDPVNIPDTARPLFAEAVYDLPCVITFEAPRDAPAVAPPPSAAQGSITFGCFNRVAKVTEPALALWARILLAVPDSRLVMKDGALGDQATRDYVLNSLVRHGVAAERIVLKGGTPYHEHLQAFSEIDIALDPFPQNGGISTYDALWMGVPVVAMLGNSGPSRVAGAILHAVGLPDWVAADADSYVNLAVSRATSREILARLRGDLRAMVATSAAGDSVRYTRAVEDAYRLLWRRWCQSQR